MTDYQQKDMEGVLFKNDEATPENKQPLYSGSITIKGVKYNLGSWLNTGKKSGKKFMSLRASEWGKRNEKAEPAAQPSEGPRDGRGNNDFQDDDIPF